MCIVIDRDQKKYDFRQLKDRSAENRIHDIVKRVKSFKNKNLTVYVNEMTTLDCEKMGYEYDSLLIEKLREEYNKSLSDNERSKYIICVK